MEASKIVVAEAFSAGRPVVISKSDGPEELVRDGIDGFLVERNNSKALAEAMQMFINTPDLIKQMSQQIPHGETIREYVDEVEKIYHRLILSNN